jgi:hypothetical protein
MPGLNVEGLGSGAKSSGQKKHHRSAHTDELHPLTPRTGMVATGTRLAAAGMALCVASQGVQAFVARAPLQSARSVARRMHVVKVSPSLLMAALCG